MTPVGALVVTVLAFTLRYAFDPSLTHEVAPGLHETRASELLREELDQAGPLDD